MITSNNREKIWNYSLDYLTAMRTATIKPYKPRTSANTRIMIIPIYIFGCWLQARNPASVMTPMATPEATPHSPTPTPAARCAKPLVSGSVLESGIVLGDWVSQALLQPLTRMAMTRPQMPTIPPITIGRSDFITSSGRITEIAARATPPRAVAYALPRARLLRANRTTTPLVPLRGSRRSKRSPAPVVLVARALLLLRMKPSNIIRKFPRINENHSTNPTRPTNANLTFPHLHLRITNTKSTFIPKSLKSMVVIFQ